MKERGEDECPIDGVGFQNHIGMDFDDANITSVKQNVQRYNKIGVEVQFTETDVRCSQFGDCNYTDEWPEEAL